MSQILQLPDSIYRALLEAAKSEGTTPEAWIADKLPKPSGALTAEQRRVANARLRECMVSLGHATGTDNEGIDADLAREYGADHGPISGPIAEK